MEYDWKPTDRRSATTDLDLVARSRRGSGPAPSSGPVSGEVAVAAAAEEFLEAAAEGQVLNRSGRPYRPSALRDLRGCLEYHVLPALGDVPLRDVRRRDVQALVDALGDERLSESRIRSVISALRALYGWAIEHGRADYNPADALVMPRVDEPACDGDEAPSWGEDGRAAEDPATSWKDRLGELWEERPRREDWPRWEERPRLDDRPRREERPGRDDTPRWEEPPPGEDGPRWEDRTAPSRASASRTSDRSWADDRSRRARAPRRSGDRDAYQPISRVAEPILVFALRAVFVLFALVVLASLLESL
jgi:hypothetical protein